MLLVFKRPSRSQAFRGRVYCREIYEIESLGVSPFLAGGNSRSLVVSNTNGPEKIVGILLGGNNAKSYALPIQSILRKPGIGLLDAHAV